MSSGAELNPFLEAAPDAIVIVDSTGRILMINAQTERLFGYRRDELHGQRVEILVPERYRGGHTAHRAGYFAKPGVQAMAGSPTHGPWERLDGLRVLIVDDQADERELFTTILEHSGADVRAVGTAGEALGRVTDWRPDVLVSDIAMPGEDGYTLLRKVRALPPDKGGDTPAVAVTAHARSEDRERALAAGFQAYVAKPIDRRRLVEVVAVAGARHLERSRD